MTKGHFLFQPKWNRKNERNKEYDPENRIFKGMFWILITLQFKQGPWIKCWSYFFYFKTNIFSHSSLLKVSKFQKQIFLFSFEPKTERIIFWFLVVHKLRFGFFWPPTPLHWHCGVLIGVLTWPPYVAWVKLEELRQRTTTQRAGLQYRRSSLFVWSSHSLFISPLRRSSVNTKLCLLDK